MTYRTIGDAFENFLKAEGPIETLNLTHLIDAFYAGAEAAFELEWSCKRGSPWTEDKMRWLETLNQWSKKYEEKN